MERKPAGAALPGAAVTVDGIGVAGAAPTGCGAGLCPPVKGDGCEGAGPTGAATAAFHVSPCGFDGRPGPYRSGHTCDAARFTDADLVRSPCAYTVKPTVGASAFRFQDRDEAGPVRKRGSAHGSRMR